MRRCLTDPLILKRKRCAAFMVHGSRNVIDFSIKEHKIAKYEQMGINTSVRIGPTPIQYPHPTHDAIENTMNPSVSHALRAPFAPRAMSLSVSLRTATSQPSVPSPPFARRNSVMFFSW